MINDNTKKMEVLNKQNTAEIELTVQRLAKAHEGNISFEDLTAQQQDILLMRWEEDWKEKRERDKFFEVSEGEGMN